MVIKILVFQAQKPVTMVVGDSKGVNNRLRVVHRVIRLEVNSKRTKQNKDQYYCNSL
jgi:hypothetical protein